jgi:hypothetical protein
MGTRSHLRVYAWCMRGVRAWAAASGGGERRRRARVGTEHTFGANIRSMTEQTFDHQSNTRSIP